MFKTLQATIFFFTNLISKQLFLYTTLLLLFLNQPSFGQQKKVDSLLTVLKNYSSVSNSLSDTSRIKTLNALSDNLWHLNEYGKALVFATQAKELTEKLISKSDDSQKKRLIKFLASSLSNIGIINDFKGNYPEALDYFFKTLKLNESIDSKEGIATTLNNIGIIYYEEQDFPKALKYYNDALKIQEAMDDKQAISFSLNNLGLIYSDQHKIKEALDHYLRSLKIKEELGDKEGIVSALLNIGGVYALTQDYSKTLEYQFKALKLNEELNDQNDNAKLLNNIGIIYHLQKNYIPAIEYCTKSLNIAKEIGALDLIASAEERLSMIYSDMKNDSKAFEHYKGFIKAKDSLFNVESTQEIVRSEMNFDFEKKQAVEKAQQEKKDALNAEELKQQKMQRNYFIAGFILVLLFAIFIFRGYQEKKKANTIIAEQKAMVEEKNKDITDSINYARKIQTAILPSIESIQIHLKESFVLYQPKDIVSGDFYWFTEKNNKLLFAVADCTGHGVPGAFMSMIGNDLLTQIVIEKEITQPNLILTNLHEGVKNALKQDAGSNETKDGMDIGIISIDKNTSTLEFAGALRPLWFLKKDSKEITEFKGNKHSIGGSYSSEARVFTNHTISFNNGDLFYLSSDGYADQFGGDQGKKFMSKNMKELLVSIQDNSMTDQKNILEKTFRDWKANTAQIDDVLVVGFKL